jgi:alcohol dehydrogenase class IV
MKYTELKQKVPEHLKVISELQTAGVKPNGKLAIGFGLAEKVGEEASKYGQGKALLITDKTIVSLGMHNIVVESLEKSGFKVDIFDEVEPEPHLESVRKAQNMVKNGKYAVVIGMGGGSSMDTAKMTAIMGTNQGDILQYMTGTPVSIEPLPIILLPTTSGTGSEVSPFMIATIDGKKMFITTTYGYASVSLVDPLLTVTMPPKVTAATGLDALTHGVEGLIAKRTPISETLTNKCVEYVFNFLDKACSNGDDLEARYYMSFASVFGMMAYVQGGGLYAHSMSYVLTLYNNLPHGLGCGIALPYTLMFNFDYIKEMLAKFAIILDHKIDKSEEDLAYSMVEKFHQLLRKVNIPVGLEGLGISYDKVPDFADELLNKYYRVKNPRSMNANEARKLLDSMWHGKLAKI